MKYENGGNVITIKLEDYGYARYSAECLYRFDKTVGKYVLTIRLKHESIEQTYKIDTQDIDTQYISGTRETIRSNICKIVERACQMKYFDKYIAEYEYAQKCFYIGDEAIDAIQLKEKIS